MWINSQNNIVLDNTDYISPEGTQYPASFPRNEIPGLIEVPDDDPTIIRKQEEIKRNANSSIYAKLQELDVKMIRALEEDDAVRKSQIIAQKQALRSQLL